MILKGSARGSGQNLAAHLMRLDDNEHVRLYCAALRRTIWPVPSVRRRQ